MRRSLLLAIAFAAGCAVGVVTTSHAWITSAEILADAYHAEYALEQGFLAERAARSGDGFRAVVHSLNQADASSGLGFRWLERSRSKSYGDWFVQPWRDYPLLHDFDPHSADLARGRQLVEALERARAALALESFGRPDLAESQWSIAAELVPSRSREQHREFGRISGGSMPSMEAAFLDSRTSQELSAALAEIRQEIDAGDSN